MFERIVTSTSVPEKRLLLLPLSLNLVQFLKINQPL